MRQPQGDERDQRPGCGRRNLVPQHAQPRVNLPDLFPPVVLDNEARDLTGCRDHDQRHEDGEQNELPNLRGSHKHGPPGLFIAGPKPGFSFWTPR